MRITIEINRPARRTVVLLVGLLLLVTPTAVWASHQFSDVPTGNPFHSDIDWLADYGVTTGFDDGTYRPTDPVTRQAMAAFLHRLSNEFEVVQARDDPGSWNSFTISVQCPEDKRAIAGGGTTSASNLFMTDSYPAYPAGSYWYVRWETEDNINIDPAGIYGYALCAPRL